MTDQQKAKAIFEWKIKHIVKQPPQLPVIDDHPWHIIVRGYGMADQMADVFAVLSNYAGLKSFFLNCEGSVVLSPVISLLEPSFLMVDGIFVTFIVRRCSSTIKTNGHQSRNLLLPAGKPNRGQLRTVQWKYSL
jgi:hypothetical protein